MLYSTLAKGRSDMGKLADMGKLGAIIDSGEKAGIKAYHGSPHDFDEFKTEAIGTGEGVQLYGHGLYFAESEDVARGYRDALASRKPKPTYKGRGYDELEGPEYRALAAIEALVTSNSIGKLSPKEAKGLAITALKQQKKRAAENIDPAIREERLKDYDEDLAALESMSPDDIVIGGSMYKVNIDADPDELVDWDAPVSEQPKAVQEVVAAYKQGGDLKQRFGLPYDPSDEQIMHRAVTAPAVVERFIDEGIKGVKYADAFTRHKSKDKRSNNYVIFDPRIIGISKKYGISIPAAYATVQAEESEAGMRDMSLRGLRQGMDIAEKVPAQFNRGARNMGKRASLSPQEKSAIEESLLGGDSRLAMNVARDWKKRHPNSDWEQPNITGASLTKDNKIALKFKAMPYAYNIDPKTGKKVEAGSPQFEKISDGVAGEIIDYFKRSENPDDLAAINVINNANWYKKTERRLRNEYGSFSEMMGDLLGATSPNTPVATNFKFTKDILDGFARGEFDELMEGFADSLDARYALQDQAEAYLKAEREAGRKAKDIKEDSTYTTLLDESKNIGEELRDQRNIIRQRNGKQFGINSYNAMVALADRFRIRRVGSAPKAKNFAGNLVGDSQEATIDVWSARNLRRHSGRKPIPSSAEQGVTGNIIDPDNFVSSLEFGFGQDVIGDATDKINQFIGPDNPLYPLEPRDVQALQWFAEKDLWTKKGWTSKAGEGGSFEQMLDADPVESMFLGLSREQSMDTQGKDFVPTSGQMLESMSSILKPANTDPDVVTYKGLPTSGAYLGSPETALDIDIVSRQDFIPVDTLDLAAAQAVEDAQDSWFVARRIRDDLGYSKPGMFTVGSEIFFDGPKLAGSDLIQDISDYLVKNNVPAYTMIVDPRDANSVIGLRVLDIPQFSGDSKKYATMSKDEYKDTAEKTYGQFQALSRNLEEEFGQVKAATPAYFDVNVKSLADTQDYLGQHGTASRDPDALRQEFYGFKPAQERFRQWEGQSLPYYRKYKAPDSGRGKKAEGLDGLGFKDSSPKAVGAGITGLGTVAVLSPEEASAGGLDEAAEAFGSNKKGTVVKPRGAPDDVAFKAARKPGIASLQQASNTSPALAALEAYLPLSQLGLGAASEIAGTLAGGTVGVGEYLRGLPIFWSPERGTHSPRPATAESIRNIREDVSRGVGGLYDAGPEAQDLGRKAMQGIGGIVGPTIDYAMEGPIMGDRGVNMLPLTAQALEKSYEGWKGLYDLLPEREQEAIISTTDVML